MLGYFRWETRYGLPTDRLLSGGLLFVLGVPDYAETLNCSTVLVFFLGLDMQGCQVIQHRDKFPVLGTCLKQAAAILERYHCLAQCCRVVNTVRTFVFSTPSSIKSVLCRP